MRPLQRPMFPPRLKACAVAIAPVPPRDILRNCPPRAENRKSGPAGRSSFSGEVVYFAAVLLAASRSNRVANTCLALPIWGTAFACSSLAGVPTTTIATMPMP